MKTELESKRFTKVAAEPFAVSSDESLVTDPRAGLTPAEMVERKLVSLLPHAPLPVSRLQQSTGSRRPPLN